ncbi:MAG TPA: signal peptidase I [Terriglobales bacterium]|nr:signal peptidase I [Terriglobales bacterium]
MSEQPHTHEESRASGWPGSVQSLAETVVIAIFIITFLVQAFQIPSESMENTLLIGDYLLVDKVHFAQGGLWGNILPYRPVKRGDIIVFRYPVRPTEHFVKRVVAVPGDEVRLHNKRLLVNGQPVPEDYVLHKLRGRDSFRDNFPATDFFTSSIDAGWFQEMRGRIRNGGIVVPPGKYFVLGDNRDESLDSRYWGFVPRENIVGRPLLIYWSVNDNGQELAAVPDGTLSRLAYGLAHLFQNTRWERTFRIVR